MNSSYFSSKHRPKITRRSLKTKTNISHFEQLTISVSKQNLPKVKYSQTITIPELAINSELKRIKSIVNASRKLVIRCNVENSKRVPPRSSKTFANNISSNSNSNAASGKPNKNNFCYDCDSNSLATDLENTLTGENNDLILQRYSISKLLSQTENNKCFKALDIRDNSKAFIKIKNKEPFVTNSHEDYLNHSKIVELKNREVIKNQEYWIFEYYKHSLRGLNHSIPIKEVSYALLKSIDSLHSQNLVHCNITPDTILFNDHTDIKLQFSQKMLKRDAPVSISRYSAPEFILDCPYNASVDIWSFGCILAELFIGKALFQGVNEKDIFKSIMRVLGRPPHTLLRLGAKTKQYFEQTYGLLVPKTKWNIPYKKQLSRIKEIKDNLYLVDLLELCLNMNPASRINTKEALLHPFFRSCGPSPLSTWNSFE